MRGGYRPGSGKSKSGYYRGIYCGSTYELCWVIWALDNHIKFDRFQGTITNGKLTYIPDFILADGKSIIELKGYEQQDSVDKKTRLAESAGYNVTVLRKHDLTDVFEYVYKKFGTKKFYTLYDGYKPKYEYECSNCKKKFSRNERSRSKSGNVFCSRACSGLGNKPLQNKVSKELILERAKRFYYKNRDRIIARRRELYKLKKNTACSSIRN